MDTTRLKEESKRAIGILRRCLSVRLATIHEARLEAVFAALDALLRGGRLSLTALGRAIGGAVAAKHSIKRIDRLLGNRHLHAEVTMWFATIAEALARQILPTNCRPIIETDAGYKNPWFKVVRKLGWHFVGRVPAGVLAIGADAAPATKRDREAWFRADSLHSRATTKPSDIGCHTLAKSNPLDVRLVLVMKHDKGRYGSKKVTRKGVHPGSTSYKKYQRRAREPGLLATSLNHQTAKQIVALYSERMQIEETFRDTKNHRFGWSFEDARSDNAQRLQVLFLLAALGILGLHLVGVAAERLNLHLRYQANTIRTRRVLSFFVLGKMIVTTNTMEAITTERLEEAMEEVRRALRGNGF